MRSISGQQWVNIRLLTPDQYRVNIGSTSGQNRDTVGSTSSHHRVNIGRHGVTIWSTSSRQRVDNSLISSQLFYAAAKRLVNSFNTRSLNKLHVRIRSGLEISRVSLLLIKLKILFIVVFRWSLMYVVFGFKIHNIHDCHPLIKINNGLRIIPYTPLPTHTPSSSSKGRLP